MVKGITLGYRQDLLAKRRKKKPFKRTETTAVEQTRTHMGTHTEQKSSGPKFHLSSDETC